EPPDEERARMRIPIHGEHPQGGPYDLFALAEQLDRARLPALRIDCGTEDSLLEHNRRFHAHLETLGIPHQYAEFPGGHDWAYWDSHIRDTLSFVVPILGIGTT